MLAKYPVYSPVQCGNRATQAHYKSVLISVIFKLSLQELLAQKRLLHLREKYIVKDTPWLTCLWRLVEYSYCHSQCRLLWQKDHGLGVLKQPSFLTVLEAGDQMPAWPSASESPPPGLQTATFLPCLHMVERTSSGRFFYSWWHWPNHRGPMHRTSANPDHTSQRPHLWIPSNWGFMLPLWIWEDTKL